MSEQIYARLEALPESNMTVKTLQMLDRIVEGEWQNIVSFQEMIEEITGEDDAEYLQEIGEYAIELFDREDEGYQRALQLYTLVDDVDKVAGAAALANAVSDKFSFLGFLESITPDDELTQAIDAGVKFAAEMAAFCYINGMPGDSVGDFVQSLAHAAQTDRIRIAAWVTIDGVLPLGPNFIQIVTNKLQDIGEGGLSDNALFKKVARYLPGSSVLDKQNLILRNLNQAQDWVSGFIESKGITQGLLLDKFQNMVDVGDKGLDYVAAALDMGTNYYEHTGTQTVARAVIDRAYGEV